MKTFYLVLWNSLAVTLGSFFVWFGVGPGRGMALVFILAAVIGLLVTLFAMRAPSYKLLAEKYSE